MPESKAAAPGRKKTPGSPAKSRPRPRSGTGKAPARSRPATRRLWPMAIAACGAFSVAYVLDFSAIAHLIFASLAAQFGQHVRIVSVAVLLLSGCVLAWTSRHPAPRPVAKAPRKPRTRPSRSTEKPVPAEPAEAVPFGGLSKATDSKTDPAPQPGATSETATVDESAPRGRSSGRSRKGADDASGK
jgi:hypothetical protein